jgi:hypothetical protein
MSTIQLFLVLLAVICAFILGVFAGKPLRFPNVRKFGDKGQQEQSEDERRRKSQVNAILNYSLEDAKKAARGE